MIKIPTKKLNEKTYIPVLGIGTAPLRGTELVNTLLDAFELGYRHIDTADYYMNHRDIKEAVERSGIKRDEIFITSKVWKTDLKEERVKSVLHRTLEELGTDYLDLFLIHAPSEEVPISETLGAMKDLQDEGLVNAIGVSNFNKTQIEVLLDTQQHWSTEYKVVNNQIRYSPSNTKDPLVQYCFDNDISVTAYSPFGKGKDLDMRELRVLADKYEKSIAQIILKWIIQKGLITIPRSTSHEHLEENINIFDWKLDSDDINKINNL